MQLQPSNPECDSRENQEKLQDDDGILKLNFKDTLEIYQAYTRSRFIRIRKFVKKLLLKASKLSQQALGIKKQMLYTNSAREFVGRAMAEKKTKQEFFNALKEKIERDPTTSISKTNLYEKIIDLNLSGEAAYHYLIKSECL